jgi:hypothetical protein
VRRIGANGRERCALFAEKASDEEAGHRMLRISADYEQLAERAETANNERPVC